MKKKINYIIDGVVIIIVLVIGFAIYKNIKNPTIKEYLNNDKVIMDNMMDKMMGVKVSGNPSLDFLNGMIPHHEGAIEMANNLLKYGGETPEIKKIADDILAVQGKEIEEMQALIKEVENNPKLTGDKLKAYEKEYKKINNMNHHGVKGKTVDLAFADGMILHHQMAIDMSELVIKYSTDEKIIKLANGIITVQNDEIKVMQNIINNSKE